MKIGDLVKYCGIPHHAGGRRTGIVLQLDVYDGSPNYPERNPIAKILWERDRSWISWDQVRVIDASR